ncbi:unnamed protein product [Phytophthora lilii]|uniref:Unnamed protein product n=1 Tax=Phytophthora lilii TaxID=2077276 RepID=A0A9W6UEZ7_9STRA|nr:unnamed protein product [Phytophthora lilii]
MGASGNLGGSAADFAIELAKAEDHLGVEVVSASYDDLDSMRKAFEGAEAVATISTWLIGDRRRNQIKNALDVAKEMGVKRFCYTSGAGAGVKAEKEEDIPYLLRDHHYIEQLSDLNTISSVTVCTQTTFRCTSHHRGSSVATSGCISGYKGELVDMPDEELRKWWLDRGLPKDVYGDFSQLPMKLCIDDLLCCGEMMANGCMTPASDAVEKLTGRKPIGFKETQIKFKDIFSEVRLSDRYGLQQSE